MTAAMDASFNRIFFSGKGAPSVGRLKLNASGCYWKGNDTTRYITAHPKDITGLTWTHVYKGFQLRLGMANGAALKYEGFRDADLKAVEEFASTVLHGNIKVEQGKIDTSGQSWGEIEAKKPSLTFKVDGNAAFDIPLADISQATTQGKSDVNLDLALDDTAAPNEETLQYITFQCPTGEPPEDPEELENWKSPAAILRDDVIDAAGITDDTGSGLCVLEQVRLELPRGRYDIELHHTFLHLRGKSYSYTVKYAAITGLYQLPRSDMARTRFLVSLDPPIRQGKTAYPSIVMEFLDAEDMELEMNETEEVLAEKYGDRIKKVMSGPANDVIAAVFRGLTNFKPKRPRTFQTGKGAQSLRCTHKTSDGFLYPLEKSFVFVPKAVLLAFDDIKTVEFGRLSTDRKADKNSTYDLVVTCRDGTSYTFQSLRRENFRSLFAFVKHKELRIKNLKAIQAQEEASNAKPRYNIDNDTYDAHAERAKAEGEEEGSESDDSDFEDGGASSSDEDFGGSDDDDESMSDKPKKKAKIKVKAPKQPKGKSKKSKRSEDDGDDKPAKKKAKKEEEGSD